MSDVRSLEEVIAAADPNPKYVKEIAAAVREWCLAPEQVERAALVLSKMTNGQTVWPMDRERTRAVLQAVMGDAS